MSKAFWDGFMILILIAMFVAFLAEVGRQMP